MVLSLMIIRSSPTRRSNHESLRPPSTDSLPIPRRTVIMTSGLAAAAIAGLSSCTNYSTAPASAPSTPTSGGSSPAAGPLTVKEADIPVGSGKIFPDAQAVITQPKRERSRRSAPSVRTWDAW